MGGVQGTEKLHSSECFHFFFPGHCCIVPYYSQFDVDFIIWFLKRWYFFQEKNQAIMNVYFFVVAGNFLNLLHTCILM